MITWRVKGMESIMMLSPSIDVASLLISGTCCPCGPRCLNFDTYDSALQFQSEGMLRWCSILIGGENRDHNLSHWWLTAIVFCKQYNHNLHVLKILTISKLKEASSISCYFQCSLGRVTENLCVTVTVLTSRQFPQGDVRLSTTACNVVRKEPFMLSKMNEMQYFKMVE